MLYYDLSAERLDLCAPDRLRMAAASMLNDRARGTSTEDEEEGEEEQDGEEELGFMFSRRRLLGGGKRQLHSLDFKMAVIGTSTHFRIFNVYIDGVNTVPVLAQTGVNYLWGRK
jgi:hypothetical protein